jgi:hypothetical protein
LASDSPSIWLNVHQSTGQRELWIGRNVFCDEIEDLASAYILTNKARSASKN